MYFDYFVEMHFKNEFVVAPATITSTSCLAPSMLRQFNFFVKPFMIFVSTASCSGRNERRDIEASA